MTIEDWLTTAYAIERRRSSAAKYEARAKHLRAFPMDEIDVELDLAFLDRAGAILKGPPHHHLTGSSGRTGGRGAAHRRPRSSWRWPTGPRGCARLASEATLPRPADVQAPGPREGKGSLSSL